MWNLPISVTGLTILLNTIVLISASRKASPDIFTDGLLPSRYSVVTGFFEQDEDSTEAEGFDVTKSNFGLKHGVSWSDIIEHINEKNEENFHKGEAYKLFFLARHGEGYHNVAPSNFSHIDWRCFWQIRDGDGEVSWHDAELTADGIKQAQTLSSAWSTQLHDKKDPVPLPNSFYVSPLRRTCQTFDYTWAPITNYESDSDYVPTVKEMARETYGIGTESERHSKSYIHTKWPSFEFEAGFTEKDELWNPKYHESKQHRNYRANLLLNDLFSNDPSTVISITSHSGTISSILKTINHRKFPLGTGQMIPVLVKASGPSSFKKPSLEEPWTSYHEQCKDYKSSAQLIHQQQSVFELPPIDVI